jgi:hypothetical protein
VPLHAPTDLIRRARLAPAAIALAAACTAVGGTTAAIGDGQAVPDRSISRFDDIEANKAKSMRALGLAIMQSSPPAYGDLEANKAASRRAR